MEVRTSKPKRSHLNQDAKDEQQLLPVPHSGPEANVTVRGQEEEHVRKEHRVCTGQQVSSPRGLPPQLGTKVQAHT